MGTNRKTTSNLPRNVIKNLQQWKSCTERVVCNLRDNLFPCWIQPKSSRCEKSSITSAESVTLFTFFVTTESENGPIWKIPDTTFGSIGASSAGERLTKGARTSLSGFFELKGFSGKQRTRPALTREVTINFISVTYTFRRHNQVLLIMLERNVHKKKAPRHWKICGKRSVGSFFVQDTRWIEAVLQQRLCTRYKNGFAGAGHRSWNSPTFFRHNTIQLPLWI